MTEAAPGTCCQSPKRRPQFRIRHLLIATAAVAVGLGLFFQMAGPVIPAGKLNRLRPGMTQAEVIRILGRPQWDDGGEWVYERWGNPGWVEVRFDGEGRFAGINDESPFPQRLPTTPAR